MVEPIYVAKSKFGRGVFAARKIRKGESICVIKGKKVSSRYLYLIIKQGRNILVDPLQIDYDKFIIMDEPYLLINHSCEPNAGLRNNVNLFAIKKIKKDEEIYYDYSITWFDGFNCQCGSKNCRKHISDYFTIPMKVRLKYKQLRIIPEFISKIDP